MVTAQLLLLMIKYISADQFTLNTAKNWTMFARLKRKITFDDITRMSRIQELWSSIGVCTYMILGKCRMEVHVPCHKYVRFRRMYNGAKHALDTKYIRMKNKVECISSCKKPNSFIFILKRKKQFWQKKCTLPLKTNCLKIPGPEPISNIWRKILNILIGWKFWESNQIA